MTKQAINRHIARADALGDDLQKLEGTSLDKGVEMDALANLPEPERTMATPSTHSSSPIGKKPPSRTWRKFENSSCQTLDP